MRRSLLAALLLLAAAAPLGAQIIRPGARSSEPTWFASLGAGLANPAPVADGESRSDWFFDNGFTFRASLERALRNQASIGIVASYGRFPLTYERFEPILDDIACGDVCDADADVLTAHALFHVGGGEGLHQVIELQAGITNYRNFRTSGGESLAPESDTDFSFAAGYGFGFGFSRTLALTLVQEWGLAMHGDEGLDDRRSSWNRTDVFRVGLRYGVGSIPRF